MKKLFVLLMVALLTIAGVAMAENNNDQILLLNTKASLRADVTVSGEMKCGSPLTLKMDVTGGTAPYKYEYNVLTEEEYLKGNSNIIIKSSNASETVTLVQPGTYYVLVRVTDAAGKSAYAYDMEVEMPESAEYPSLQTVVSRLAAQCKASCSTEYERALWVHDYIINHADYDAKSTYYSADGVLIRGKGACDSYRLAVEMLMNAVGIKCGSVLGSNHAWNIAFIEGDWYMIDATWDDPAGGSENHNYFCVTTEMIRKDHTITGYTSYSSECTALKCNYAVRTGMTERWMSEDVMGNNPLTKQVETALKNGQTEFKLTVPKMYAASSTGSSYTSSSSSWQLAWPATAYAMTEKTWEVDGNEYQLQVTSSVSSKSLNARVVSMSACAPCEHSAVTYVDNKNGSHTVICSACGETVETMCHSCDNGRCVGCSASVTQMKLPGVKEIEEEAFEGTFAYSVIVPSGCTSIGSRAFADSNTRVFVLPDSVTMIAEDAFCGCSNIVFQASENSYAAQYAMAHGIQCI